MLDQRFCWSLGLRKQTVSLALSISTPPRSVNSSCQVSCWNLTATRRWNFQITAFSWYIPIYPNIHWYSIIFPEDFAVFCIPHGLNNPSAAQDSAGHGPKHKKKRVARSLHPGNGWVGFETWGQTWSNHYDATRPMNLSHNQLFVTGLRCFESGFFAVLGLCTSTFMSTSHQNSQHKFQFSTSIQCNDVNPTITHHKPFESMK